MNGERTKQGERGGVEVGGGSGADLEVQNLKRRRTRKDKSVWGWGEGSGESGLVNMWRKRNNEHKRRS